MLVFCCFAQIFSGTLCLRLGLLLCHLCWSDHGATLWSILWWYFPWKAAVFHSISQSTATLKTSSNFHTQKREGQLFLMMDTHSQKKDLLLSLNRWSLLLGDPRALFCMLPSKGQQRRSLWHLCTSVLRWLWADYLDKDHRECRTLSQPISCGWGTSRLDLNYAILLEAIFVPSLGGCTCNNSLNIEHCVTFSGCCLLGKSFSYTIGIFGSCPIFNVTEQGHNGNISASVIYRE